MVRVKSNFDGDIRRFVLPAEPTYSALFAHLSTAYGFADFQIKYKDDEGDLITMTNDPELNEAIITATENDILRLSIVRTGTAPARVTPTPETPARMTPVAASTAAAAAARAARESRMQANMAARNANTTALRETMEVRRTAAATAASATAPFSAGTEPSAEPTAPSSAGVGASNTDADATNTGSGTSSVGAGASNFGAESFAGMEQMFQGLGFMLENAFRPRGGMRGMRGRGGRRGMRGRGGRCGHGGRHGRPGGRFGGGDFDWTRMFNVNEGDLSQMINNFDPARFGGMFSDVAQGTMEALRDTMRALAANPGPSAMLAAVPTVLPAVRGFLNDLGATGPVIQERVETFVGALTSTLASALGADGAARVASFARIALADPAVIALLRRVAGVGASWGGGAAEAARDAGADVVSRVEQMMTRLGRLDVHDGVACDECGMEPMVGTRHKCSSRDNYDLCDSCYNSVDRSGTEFRAVNYPWEAEQGRALVPRPTLVYGSQGVEVMFLQHLLTNLGYMTPADYRVRVGYYGPRTADAVNLFRADFGLGTQGTYGLYDDVTAASLLSVLDSRAPPVTSAGAGPSSAGAGTTSESMDTDNSSAAA